jgi:hypothetical protein
MALHSMDTADLVVAAAQQKPMGDPSVKLPQISFWTTRDAVPDTHIVRTRRLA